MSKELLKPLAFLYGLGVKFRHLLFDAGVLKQKEYDIPIICIGNITVGGTGKTPMCEFLIANLMSRYNVAVLSRGYGRRTKGYREVKSDSSFLDTGDEPKQLKLKFSDIVVAVCENRRKGIETIRHNHPKVNLIILDDAFQHRYVEPWVNVLLVDYTRPTFEDCLLPAGNLRDVQSQIRRAHFIVVTKAPENINNQQMRIFTDRLNPYPFQKVYFCTIKSYQAVALYHETTPTALPQGAPVLAMAGIGNPESYIATLQKKYKVVDKLMFRDHYPYRMSDQKTMLQKLDESPSGTVIVTTQKDAVKLTNARRIDKRIQERLYYLPISVLFLDNSADSFLRNIERYVRENQKYSLIH